MAIIKKQGDLLIDRRIYSPVCNNKYAPYHHSIQKKQHYFHQDEYLLLNDSGFKLISISGRHKKFDFTELYDNEKDVNS